jgi:probable HAF family extracellular repeat protein
VNRLSLVPFVALVVWSCNASDDALGVDRGPEQKLAGGATNSVTLSRVDLGSLGGASSYAAGINASNIVVGWSETAGGATHAFRWSAAAGMIDLGTLPGDASSRAVAVLDGTAQNGGQILGMSGEDGRWTPVVWSANGSISALPTPLISGFVTALPTAFNAGGDVVGSDAGGLGLQHGWIWSQADGKFDLSANVGGGSNEGAANAVTASGTVLVTTRASSCVRSVECWRTYLWTRSRGYSPIGTPGNDSDIDVTGLALNEAGSVAGWVTTSASGKTIPSRWSASTGFTLLRRYAPESASYGYAAAVNSNGTVVGAAFEPATGSIVASTWLANGSIVKLSPNDPNSSIAIAINNSGTIAGWASIANGVNHAVIWQRSSQATQTAVRSSATLTARVTVPGSDCLADARSITSRQAIFGCVAKSGWTR